MDRLKDKNLDFISAAKRKSLKDSRLHVRIVIMILIPILLTGSSVLLSVNYTYKTRTVYEQIDRIHSYLNGEELAERQERAENIQSEVALIRKHRSNLEAADLLLERKPVLTKEVLSLIIELGGPGTVVSGIQYREGSLSFRLHTLSYQDLAEYVGILEETDGFDQVDYSGFQRRKPDQNLDVLPYESDITIHLSKRQSLGKETHEKTD